MPTERSQRRAQVVIRVAFDVNDIENIHTVEKQVIRATKQAIAGRKHIAVSSSARAWREA